MAGWALGNRHARLAGVFLASMGISFKSWLLNYSGSFSSYPLTLGWVAINTVGHVKRGVALAFVSALGGISSIIGAFTFVASDSPRYLQGYSICVGFLGMSFILTLVYLAGLVIENRARDAGKREHLRNVPPGIELADHHVLISHLNRLRLA